MFCEKCGMSNRDDAVFCENCGADLGNGLIQPSARTQVLREKKPFPKMLFVLLAELALLILLIFGSFQLAEKEKSPQREAERYFVNIANGDWEAALAQVDLAADGDFLKAVNFASAQIEEYPGVVQNYQLQEDEQDSGIWYKQLSEGQKSKRMEDGIPWEEKVVIDYQAQGKSEGSSYMVGLQNISGNWKVKGADLICADYEIFVPKGANVRVDGIFLGDTYAMPTGEGDDGEKMDGYCIPYIFYGIHNIEVSMEGMEDVTGTFWIEHGDSQYELKQMSPKKETLDELLVKCKENMQKIYDAAAQGRDFADIEALFTAEEDMREEIRESYDNLRSDFEEESIQMENIRFYDITGEASPDGSMVSVQFAYEMQYMEKDQQSNRMKRNASSGNERLEFYFVIENGQWVQENLGCEFLY